MNLSLDDAKKLITSHQLSIGEIRKQKTAKQAEGTVIVQAPQANKQVAKAYPIRLVVAVPLSKPVTTKVPNLHNMSLNQAKATIRKAKLKLGKVTYRKPESVTPK